MSFHPFKVPFLKEERAVQCSLFSQGCHGQIGQVVKNNTLLMEGPESKPLRWSVKQSSQFYLKKGKQKESFLQGSIPVHSIIIAVIPAAWLDLPSLVMGQNRANSSCPLKDDQSVERRVPSPVSISTHTCSCSWLSALSRCSLITTCSDLLFVTLLIYC